MTTELRIHPTVPAEFRAAEAWEELQPALHVTSTRTATEWQGSRSVVSVLGVRLKPRTVLVGCVLWFVVSRIWDSTGGQWLT
jgi:hypothetical protein